MKRFSGYYPTAMVGIGQIQDPSVASTQSNINHARAWDQSQTGLTNGLKIGGMLAQQVGGMIHSFLPQGQPGLAKQSDLLSGISTIGNGLASIPMFALGGQMVNGELEGGEVIEHPDGSIQEVVGPSHENGGVPMSFDSLSRIYSNRVKIDGVSIADRTSNRVKRNVMMEDLVHRNPYDTVLRKSWERSTSNARSLREQEMALQEHINKLIGNG